MTGLSSEQAAAELRRTGPNELPSRDRHTTLQLVVNVLREPMLVLLLIAGGLYLAFGDLAEAIALAVSVVAIISITLAQERRTERALEALRELANPHARVMRDGEWREIDARELVPGDVIHIGEGDRVPADGVVRDGTPLSVDESLLTGESVAVMRAAGDPVHASTLVTDGNATAEVTGTGARTEVGRIGAALDEIDLARPPLYAEVMRVVRVTAIVAFAMCIALFGVHLASHHGLLVAGLAAIALAMSLLPEELPLVLTVFLTLGARRMTKHRVLARRAAAIETLGAVTVLCVDKTGTLTENQMAIRRIVTDEVYDVPASPSELPESCHDVVELGLLACPRNTVDAMDRAFARLAAATLATTEHVHPEWTWVQEYPLSRSLLAVTHVWRADAQRVVIATKGAPEAIIDLCHLEPAAAALWRSRVEAMAVEGLRVLGVARAVEAMNPLPENVHDMPFEMVGLVGLLDPLRGDTAATIETCHSAGVRVLMITGDHAATARAIGRAAGLRDREPLAGAEVDTLDDAALAARLAETDVVARAAPAHKLRIIRVLRAAGEVVAMTGDGVNDAPALKAADIGIAMGQGTDVARESAGLVLLEPSLAAIAAAIRTGRRIYDNLRKVAGYLLAVHLPIAGLALIPPLLDWPLLLGPIHIVLLELVIDPTCSIVFEMEPAAADVMQRPPRGRSERLFAARQVAISAVRGLVALAGPGTVAAIAQLRGAPPETVRALGFAALIAADVALVVAAGARNRAVAWITAAILAVMAVIFAVPAVRALFGFGALTLPQLGLAALAAVPVLATANWIRRPKIIKRP